MAVKFMQLETPSHGSQSRLDCKPAAYAVSCFYCHAESKTALLTVCTALNGAAPIAPRLSLDQAPDDSLQAIKDGCMSCASKETPWLSCERVRCAAFDTMQQALHACAIRSTPCAYLQQYQHQH